jgi:hypothetical protein
MNLLDQLGALETGLEEILQNPAAPASPVSPPAPAADTAPEGKPTLIVSRPEQNAIEMKIGGQSVVLSPEGVSQLIEELANARASMSVEQPGNLPPGWRFAATKNPVMATQRYPNGDRLLVMRHTGHGWVPFSFSPETIVEMYALLTAR